MLKLDPIMWLLKKRKCRSDNVSCSLWYTVKSRQWRPNAGHIFGQISWPKNEYGWSDGSAVSRCSDLFTLFVSLHAAAEQTSSPTISSNMVFRLSIYIAFVCLICVLYYALIKNKLVLVPCIIAIKDLCTYSGLHVVVNIAVNQMFFL